jgi:uncharacterized membrane protein YcaP (DUF421 family)
MEFTTGTTGGLFAAIVAIGIGALIVAPMMQPSTVLMMVLPSMVVFGLLTLALGAKHGEYRAKN